jgi:hypothetical protein
MPFVQDLLTGRLLSGSSDRAARDRLGQLEQAYDGVVPPELQEIALEGHNWEGDLTPEEIAFGEALQTQDIGSQWDQVKGDPRLKDMQLKALAELARVHEGGGMTAQDKASLASIQSDVAQADRGRRDAIKQNMAARGMGGSGMELLAQLQSSQASTDRASQEGLNIAGMAQDRALQAMMQQGQMAGQVRGQDFDESGRAASAKDAIAQFNAANRMRTDQFNKQGMMDAARFNAEQRAQTARFNQGGRQQTRDQNTATRNQQQMYNKQQLPQQQFQNTMTMRGAQANSKKAGLEYFQNESAADRAAWGQLVGGGAAMGAAALSDEREKTAKRKLTSADIDAFLKSVKPASYKYKDSANGEGDHPGFMAQDVEATKIGKMLVSEDEDGVKKVDQWKLQGAMLAALSHLAKKVDSKE